MLLLKKSRKSRTTGRSVEWSGVKCQNEFPSWLACRGSQEGSGVGFEAGVRTGLARTALPHHATCVFFLRVPF
jgi:hypothetical protein